MSTPKSFLIVSLRYIGDVLLSTPLARSIRTAWPGAVVDYLVFGGTESILEGNPDVRRVFTVHPGGRDFGDLLRRWDRYDVSIGVNASDRTAFQLIASGRRSIGFADPRPKEWWKRRALTHCSTYDPGRHVVELLLGQLRFLDISAVPEVVVPVREEDRAAAREATEGREFILLHPYTRWEYKKWPSANWAMLSRMIEEKTGIRTLFTTAPGAFEGRIREEIRAAGVEESRFLPGPLPLSRTAALVSLANAYVGVDTVITHMAAALGKKTVAVFGPTPPWRWGPWPNGYEGVQPYPRRGGIQRQGNVVIVQKDWDCVACDRMGCDHKRESTSRCLVELSLDEVYPELFHSMTSPRY
jgi:heptosyltransferase-3